MSVLFSDIRDFTAMSERMTPQDNFNFLNAYLGRVSPVVRRHHGFIDKYIGDAVMALFPQKPEDAIQAAIEICSEVRRYNQYRMQKARAPLRIGIGLHSGSLILGILGEEERLQGTVISDAVNLASRLEGLTKVYGASVLCSATMLHQVPDPTRFLNRSIGSLFVKGKRDTVDVVEIFEGDDADTRAAKESTRTEFEAGLQPIASVVSPTRV